MKYTIVRTDKANDQLFSLLHYIAEDNGNVGVALNYLDKIEKTVMNLEDFPYVGSIPHYSILKKQGYRVLIVERHLIFYKVNEIEKIVTIHAVVDSRREYKSLI